MEWFTTSATGLVALASLVIVANATRRFINNRAERKGLPYPPGPTPLPFIGNVHSINTNEPWVKYTEWQAKYGDIIYVRLLDSDAIVLNTVSVARELLEKRSQIYSDRPFIATVEPYGHGDDFTFSPYGEYWRSCRRMFHQTFRAEAALTFRPMQLRSARKMILSIVEDLDQYPVHYATFASSVAMSSAYGYEARAGNDPLVAMVNRFLHASISIMTPENAILLKTFPFLLFLPDWFPGSSIKREARDATLTRDRIIDTAYQYVQKRMESGDSTCETMVSEHIRLMEKLDEQYRAQYEHTLKHVSLTSVLASTETTTSILMTFTLAMIMNPRVWKRAQAEIDAVIGLDRLPEFEDRDSLPYVGAIMREALRWVPVNPLGIPHAVTKSDVYEGFYIPKGAIVLVNAWAMSRDKDRYPSPEEFLPERFLDGQGQLIANDSVTEFVFGFGRRVCPGRHAADASVWSALATMLATLDFNPPEGGLGNVVFANGTTYHPLKFPCRLTPRTHITKEALERILAK